LTEKKAYSCKSCSCMLYKHSYDEW
jgi:hypothetical protein